MWRRRFQPIRDSLLGIGLGWSRRIELQKHLRFGAPFSSVPAEPADPEELRVFVIAGEPSGDVIGSRLMASLRHLSPKPLRFSGVGGASMEREGLASIFKMEDITVMGAAELFPHLFRIWARLRQTVAAAVEFKPHLVVTVDTKGFSFRVLRSLAASYEEKREQAPFLVHYVAPSYWAWKAGDAKLKNLSEFMDHLLCILPFEAAMCKANGVGATFVGHPVLEDAFMNVSVWASWYLNIHEWTYPSSESGKPWDLQSGNNNAHKKWEVHGNGLNFRDQHALQTGTKVISVLPGSRAQEVKRMLPIFRGAMQHIANKYSDVTAIIPTAQSPIVTDMVAESVKGWEIPVIVLPSASDVEKYDAFAASDAGLCTSGTAVMQLQLARVPSVVAYCANPITEWLIKSRTKLTFISLPNILLNSPVIPEALFEDCTPEKLASLLQQVLENKEMQDLQRDSAEQVLSMLAPPASTLLHLHGASLTVADVHSQKPSMAAATTILELLGQRDHSPIGY